LSLKLPGFVAIFRLSATKGDTMLREFKEFIARGNVIDLAVAVVIGAAFGKIVTSLVDGVIMPPIGLLLGKVDFSNLFVDLSGQHPVSLADAKAKGLPVIAVGAFLNDIIGFLIIAFVIFLIVKSVNRLKSDPPPPANTKDCPHCLTVIPLAASRCAACCSDVATA
jgi:large conductance mechanosensitive channel